MVLALMALEDWLCYPRGGAYDPTGKVAYEEVWLTTSDGVRLHAWFCACPSEFKPQIAVAGETSRPTILFFHGNGGEVSLWATIAPSWHRALGADVLIFDFRGYGKSEGAPSEPGLYRDGQAAYDYLVNDRKVDPKNIILAGRSLGGAVALEIAGRWPHAAVVIESTFTSLPDAAAPKFSFIPVRWVMRNRFASLERISRPTTPIMFSHGDEDEIVPYSHGERLFEAANEPKSFYRLRGYDHNTWPGFDYYKAVREFLIQSVGPPPG